VRRRQKGPALLGLAEVAELAGLTTARIRQLRLEGRFIEPAATVGGRNAYARADVLRWLRKRVAKPGRPPKRGRR